MKVWYQGTNDTITKIYYNIYNGAPQIAVLQSGNRVPISDLKMVPEEKELISPLLNVDKDKDILVEEGNFVLYYTEGLQSNKVMIGKIMKKFPIAKKVEIHVYDGGDIGNIYLPLWKLNSKAIRKGNQLKNSKPWLQETLLDNVVCTLELAKSSRLTEHSKARMATLGVAL